MSAEREKYDPAFVGNLVRFRREDEMANHLLLLEVTDADDGVMEQANAKSPTGISVHVSNRCTRSAMTTRIVTTSSWSAGHDHPTTAGEGSAWDSHRVSA
jgi:hypothetical protein